MGVLRGEFRPERLIEHAVWMRRLAAGLAGDGPAADDLVQDTWLAVLRRPPRRPGPLRPWLARVATNEWRQAKRAARRRERRERDSARPEAQPGPDVLVERLDLERALMEEVHALAEPLRETLLLRYMDGLEPSAIARRQGVAAGTVRWRLHRAHEELRTRLDRRVGGREAWFTLLLPLRGESALAFPGGMLGVIGMKTSAKLGAAAMVLAAAFLGAWRLGLLPILPDDEADAAVAFRPIAPEPADPRSRDRVPSLVAGDSRIALAASPSAAEPRPAPDGRAFVTARIADELDRPIPAARLALCGRELTETAWAGADGVARLALEREEERFGLSLEAWAPGFACATLFTVGERGRTIDLGTVRLAPGGAVAGRVLDPEGRPVSGAQVGVERLGGTRRVLEWRRLFSRGAPGYPAARTAVDGSFRLLGAPAGKVRVWAHAPECLASYSPPVEVRRDEESYGLELRLEPLPNERCISGFVLDPAGGPVAGAKLVFRTDARIVNDLSGRDGGFLLVIADGPLWYDARAEDPEGRWAPVLVQHVEGGMRELELRFEERPEVELRLTDLEGRALEHFAVRVLDAAGGRELDRWPRRQREQGRLELRVPPEPFLVEVDPAGCELLQLGPFDPARVPSPLQACARPVPGLRGSVLAAGEVVPGVSVSLHAEPQGEWRQARLGFAMRFDPRPIESVTSDAEGRFLLTPREARRYWILAETAGHPPAEVGPIDFEPSAGRVDVEVELTTGGAIAGRIHAALEGVPAGTIVGASRGDGRVLTGRADGAGRFRFEALTPGAWRVARVERELSPGDPVFDWARRDEIAEGGVEVFVEAGTTTFVELGRSVPRARLEGRLTIDGRPAEGWSAELATLAGRGGRDVRIDADGRFALEAAPGEWLLVLELGLDEAGETLLTDRVELDESAALSWELGVQTALVELHVPARGVGDTERLAHVRLGPGELIAITRLRPRALEGPIAVPAGFARIVRVPERANPGEIRESEPLIELDLAAGDVRRIDLR
jgi:RNA polymerase sigma factor (sigma-70 family)